MPPRAATCCHLYSYARLSEKRPNRFGFWRVLRGKGRHQPSRARTARSPCGRQARMARGAPAAPRPAARLPLRACAQGLLLAAAAASASAAPADAPLAAGTRGRLAHVHAHALVQQQKQQKQQHRGASQRQVEPACVARAGSLWVSVAADGTAYEARLSGAAAAGGGARLAAAEAAVFQLDWSTAVTSPEWDPQAPLQQRGVRVQPTQAGGCRVTRTYSRGVSTAEELAPAHQAASEAAGGNHAGASTSLPALRWAFEVHGGDERVPLEATTRFRCGLRKQRRGRGPEDGPACDGPAAQPRVRAPLTSV